MYEDDDVIVINKKRAWSCTRARARRRTLVNALMHHCGDSLSGINGDLRPGIVHRIDKDTSASL
jgi:23S rRNA pseudouridine1911/1915/1917 synthase